MSKYHYQMTKCGRYGPNTEDFDYSPGAIRKSITRSLARLHTDYLDTVYLHDVEFVCSLPPPSGKHALALSSKAAEYGLQAGDEGNVLGEGDQKVLDAVRSWLMRARSRKWGTYVANVSFCRLRWL